MKNTVTKNDFVETIAREQGIHPTDVRLVIQAFMEHVMKSLVKGKRVELRRFGVFRVARNKQRVGRNPKKASIRVEIPEKNKVRFFPAKYMKALFEDVQTKTKIRK